MLLSKFSLIDFSIFSLVYINRGYEKNMYRRNKSDVYERIKKSIRSLCITIIRTFDGSKQFELVTLVYNTIINKLILLLVFLVSQYCNQLIKSP